VGFSPDGQRIVSWGDDYKLKVWDAATGSSLAPQAGDVDSLKFANGASLRSGDRIVVADGIKLTIKQVSTGKIFFTGFDDGEIINPRFSPDGKRVVSGCADGTVKVWLQAARSAPLVVETPRDAGPKLPPTKSE
jgi:WD40 repeat protein